MPRTPIEFIIYIDMNRKLIVSRKLSQIIKQRESLPDINWPMSHYFLSFRVFDECTLIRNQWQIRRDRLMKA